MPIAGYVTEELKNRSPGVWRPPILSWLLADKAGRMLEQPGSHMQLQLAIVQVRHALLFQHPIAVYQSTTS